ncbi:MAG: glutamate-1-semialdehyde aminotransferase [Legionellales bacterium]|nr:glutamate-1-semialdehyde aminotransferase [Legionellales bacterium]
MKTITIIQARMGSTRFPDKVMQPICGTPMIGLLIERLSKAKSIDQIVLATTENMSDDILAQYASEFDCVVFRGSDKDVLDRYYKAASIVEAETIVRITGDCPLIDPQLVDEVVEFFSKKKKVDYLSNTIIPTYPDGLDIEVFTFQSLEKAWLLAEHSMEREHVTPYIKESGQFICENFKSEKDFSEERWTVDEPVDFEVVQNIFKYFHPRRDFSWHEVLVLRKEHSDWFMVNQHLIRNEGAQLGTGQKLWKRAKRVIPGGNMLLSKRAEMFLPEQWPAYFSKAKGCRVWDLDGREFIDMSIMGIGTNILGYGHPEVDEAVYQTITTGNMSTLNCSEEVYLAERLIKMHPWADMARFARTGGEANAIAIRIARAATGKDKVAICGYHGWHDWYLATNLEDEKNLSDHLLPGLEPNGVPKNLNGSVLPFSYNNISELEDLIRNHAIGVIMMEVCRNLEPEDNFLEKVRELANINNIVLIFDECSSGFRQTFGGLHKIYNIEPDMAIFGKALGNGYAITAIIGKRAIMEAAQSTFISSTFWTERIGPTAALKTLDVMEREKSWERITQTGQSIGERWQVLADKYELPITINGLASMISFSMTVSDRIKYKTLITQEMLKKEFLATSTIYVCTEHTPDLVDQYFTALDPIFALIKECEEGRKVDAMLDGPICHEGFKRLN